MAEFDILLGGVVFGSSFALDALSAYYIRTASRGEAFKASVASAGIAVLGYINLAAFIGNPAYALPEIAGGVIGTYLVVKFDSFGKRTNITKNEISRPDRL